MGLLPYTIFHTSRSANNPGQPRVPTLSATLHRRGSKTRSEGARGASLSFPSVVCECEYECQCDIVDLNVDCADRMGDGGVLDMRFAGCDSAHTVGAYLIGVCVAQKSDPLAQSCVQ